MKAEIEIRPLRKDDVRSSFDCGQPELNRFLQHYAGQNQFKLHLAVTYVAVVKQADKAEQKILAFATVASSSIERQDMPRLEQRRHWPQYPLPVLRLARLGVDKRAQGLGLGAGLLRHVLQLALQQQEQTGCVAVVCDAKAGAVDFYARYGFVPLPGLREGLLSGEAQTMILPLETIAQATKAD